jgi:glycosyltransferase involved in cell wall biosynthesis
MYRSKKFLIGIPAYNCEKQITRVITALPPEIYEAADEILVVDNQSLDNTVNAAIETINSLKLAKIKVKINKSNLGLGGTHKAIFNYALKEKFDLVAIVHGDDQARFSELKDLLEKLTSSGSEAVLGSRFMKDSKRVNYSLTRVFGNSVLNLVYSVILRRNVQDLGSGLNLFTASALKKLNYLNFSDGFTFNMDLLIGLIDSGAKIAFYPITWREHDQVSNARNFSVGWIALKTILRRAARSFRSAQATISADHSQPSRYQWE